MSWAIWKALAGDAVEIAAGELLARRKGDAVHDDVERSPASTAIRCEGGVDLGVVRDVHRQHELGAEALRHLGDAVLEPVVLIGEGELGALATHRGGDAVRDRTLGREPDDQGALAGKKTHVNLR